MRCASIHFFRATPTYSICIAVSLTVILTNTRAAAVLTVESTFDLPATAPRALSPAAIPAEVAVVALDEARLIPVAARYGNEDECVLATDLFPDVAIMSLQVCFAFFLLV